MQIRKLLIANRGEIAVRIASTCRDMGISSVAIWSDADKGALHTRSAGEAVHIGDSYLDIDRIIAAARRTGADSVHPGYGFLAENADFAEECRRAGLIFVGPPTGAIRSMGSKTSARAIAAAVGVPVIPSFRPDELIDFPVLIKASAGGGGRGMRIVRSKEELGEAITAAGGEAERSFGDGTLLIEKYIERAKHVEFQIFGDQHGNLIHLFERECSVQRRYQKIIEESPSPALDEDLRKRIGEAALAVGRAIHYTNAGTVEFLLAPSREFYFIEVNTRIQVEHPVTELTSSLDLIRMQIDVAEGKPLRRTLGPVGHALEARLYAEDPRNGFLPSTGTVRVWRPPVGARVDTAIEEGTVIGIHYDPLLAKIVCHGGDREDALRKLAAAVRSTCILGIQTNREYLLQILDSGEFNGGKAHTAWLPEPQPPHAVRAGYLAAAVVYIEETRKRLLPGVPANYRNNPYRDASMKLQAGKEEITVSWRQAGRDRYVVNGQAIDVISVKGEEITLAIDGLQASYNVKQAADDIFVWSSSGSCAIRRLPRHPRPSSAEARATANSPMPGKVLRVLVETGRQVRTGEPLVVLEAMKMEQTIRSTINGVVTSILVQPGEVVAPAQMLVQISALESPQ